MRLKKSCIFACTNKSEKECLRRKLFGTNSVYGEKVFSIKKGDLLFLLNIDTDILYGPFVASSDGGKNLEPEAWDGRYPYQVRITENGDVYALKNAKKILTQLNIEWRNQVIDPLRTDVSLKLFKDPQLDLSKIKLPSVEFEEKPKLEATTLWDYPKQSYGKSPKGDNKYPGVTPAFIIYN